MSTHTSDISELAVLYLLNGSHWWPQSFAGEPIEAVFRAKWSRLSLPACTHQLKRAEQITHVCRHYIQETYGRPLRDLLVGITWTGRGVPFSHNCAAGHPADGLLLILTGYESVATLGLSIKSYEKGEPHLKTLGAGTLDETFGMHLMDDMHTIVAQFKKKYLPTLADSTDKAYKSAVRDDRSLKALTKQLADLIQHEARERLYAALLKVPGFWRTFLETDCLTCGPAVTPPYVQLMGYGDGTPGNPYTAEIVNMAGVQFTGTITIEKKGRYAIGFRHNDNRVMLIRCKYGSEPCASDLRWNVERWKNI